MDTLVKSKAPHRGIQEPRVEATSAIDFLRLIQPAGPWLLGAVSPDGGPPQSRMFLPGEEPQLREWVREHNGKVGRHQNLYFNVNLANELGRRCPGECLNARWCKTDPAKHNYIVGACVGEGGCAREGKRFNHRSARDDMTKIVVFHADLDPLLVPGVKSTPEAIVAAKENCLVRAKAIDPPPSIINSSGGGSHAYWLLKEPIILAPVGDPDRTAQIASVERTNRALHFAAAANPAPSDVTRYLRLPNTTNWPGATKRKLGRKPSRAIVVEVHPERRYEARDFDAVIAAMPAPAAPATRTRTSTASLATGDGLVHEYERDDVVVDEHGLPLTLSKNIRAEIIGGVPEGMRSEVCFSAINQLAFAGLGYAAIVALIAKGGPLWSHYRNMSDAAADVRRALSTLPRDEILAGLSWSDEEDAELEEKFAAIEAECEADYQMLFKAGSDESFIGTADLLHSDTVASLVRLEREANPKLAALFEEWKKRKFPIREIKKAIRAAKHREPKATGKRPLVIFSRIDSWKTLDEVEKIIGADGTPIFHQGGKLVRSVRLDAASDEDEKIQRQAGALIIRPVEPLHTLELMQRAVRFAEPDSEGKLRPTTPPLSFALQFHARGEWKIRRLAGIVEAPTIVPATGRIIDQPGYDAASALILDMNHVEFPAVPDAPTKADADAALRYITDEVLAEFAFEPDDKDAIFDASSPQPSASRSVALAAILTAVTRKQLPTAPMIGISAPYLGEGKTFLAEIISSIALGRTAAVITQGGDETEDAKRIFALLREGDNVAILDNVKRTITGGTFAAVLTSEQHKGRILGVSENGLVSTRTLWLATGVNVRIGEDLIRRVLMCRLNAGRPDPGNREFKNPNLRAHVLAIRPRLVVAALTVLKAHIVAGRPGATSLSPFASYEEWSALVRAPLIWLGQPDPCATRAAIEADDVDTQELAALHEGWRKAIGVGKPVTAAYMINLVELAGDEEAELAAALRALFPGRGALTPKALGQYLHGNCDRIVDRLSIHKGGTHRSNARVYTLRERHG